MLHNKKGVIYKIVFVVMTILVILGIVYSLAKNTGGLLSIFGW